jgi:hypothetical protein
MGYRYTMVEGNKRGRYDLYCYEDDVVIWEDEFKTHDEAQTHAARFLDREDWFELAAPA